MELADHPVKNLADVYKAIGTKKKKELHIDPDRPFAECERQDIFFFFQKLQSLPIALIACKTNSRPPEEDLF